MTTDLELSKMFHEIKNPLTLISSSLQLIEQEHPEVQDFRFWTQTMKDLHNLRLLIDDLSLFQKDPPLNIQKIGLFDFTEDLLDSMEGYLQKHKISMTIEDDSAIRYFFADAQKLRHAVVNLLKNAVESSEEGSAILLRFSSDKDFFYIIVSDQGCGIRSELLPEIFEPFTTTKSYGTGLGLPIVKKTIESHHGTLSIHSKEGAGTIISLCLPLYLAKNQRID